MVKRCSEEYVVTTGDALVYTFSGSNVNLSVYGLQYHSLSGGDASTSLKIDLDGDVKGDEEDKYIYGDIDVRMERQDMGDLPDIYNTLENNNGASHIIDGITHLGAGVDAEGDGQPQRPAR